MTSDTNTALSQQRTGPDEENEGIGTDPGLTNRLAERIRNHNSSSPADAGGDLDAQWEEVDTSGSETAFGHNPTPDQSNVEENASAMGIGFEDNQPLDFVEKMEKRDRDRFELNEDSKATEDTI